VPVPSNPSTIAAQLDQLRRAGKKLPTSELPRPASIDEAMEAQRELVKREGFSPQAWKIGPEPLGRIVFAPLHPFQTVATTEFALWRSGLKFEAEIAVRLRRELQARDRTYSRDEIVDAIDKVYLGAELVFGAVEEGGKISFPLYLADRLANAQYVLGPEVASSLLDHVGTTNLLVEMEGGPVLYDGLAKHPIGDPLTWLVELANDQPETSPLRAGAIITTGTLCGAPVLPTPGDIRVQLGGVTMTLKAR
jgi:fumarylacetoacetase-like protein